MMSKSIIQSERQRPRSIELMKEIYASHVADCKHGENCPSMIDLRKNIEAAEAEGSLESGNFSRSFGLK
jgi:hypothetical protein